MNPSAHQEVNRPSSAEQRAALAQLLAREADVVRRAPASFAQRGLLTVDELQPKSPIYNHAVSLVIEGSLDANALEKSLSEIVRRHESLRTTFTSINGH